MTDGLLLRSLNSATAGCSLGMAWGCSQSGLLSTHSFHLFIQDLSSPAALEPAVSAYQHVCVCVGLLCLCSPMCVGLLYPCAKACYIHVYERVQGLLCVCVQACCIHVCVYSTCYICVCAPETPWESWGPWSPSPCAHGGPSSAAAQSDQRRMLVERQPSCCGSP